MRGFFMFVAGAGFIFLLVYSCVENQRREDQAYWDACINAGIAEKQCKFYLIDKRQRDAAVMASSFAAGAAIGAAAGSR